jgi:DNA-binding MarR family transcriptional regulator
MGDVGTDPGIETHEVRGDELVQLAARLRLAIVRANRRLRQEADVDVTPTLLSALATVQRLGPLTLGELAIAEHVQPPSMTRVVARLEEAGLVRRQADLTDRRVSRVTATTRGKQLLDRSRSRKTAFLARRIRDLSPDERDTLGRAAALIERLLAEGDRL